PDYYSCLQGAGAMFYKDTALIYKERGSALAKLNAIGFDRDKNGLCEPASDKEAFGPRRLSEVSAVCGNLPDLDMIVLMTKVEDWDPPSWKMPAVQYRQVGYFGNKEFDRYYFYDCRKLRNGLRSSSPTSTAG